MQPRIQIGGFELVGIGTATDGAIILDQLVRESRSAAVAETSAAPEAAAVASVA